MPFDEKKLRSFLCSVPKPAKVVVHTDAESREIVAGSGKTWAAIAHTIVALGDAKLVEAYEKDGTLIRAVRADEDEAKQAAQNTSLGLPTHADPETARITHFANLISRAYEFSTQLAFDKMVDLFTMQNDRMVAIESRLERTESAYRKSMNEQLQDAFAEVAEHPTPGENPLMGMVRAFLEGTAMGGADKHDTLIPPPPPPKNGNGNGHHHNGRGAVP